MANDQGVTVIISEAPIWVHCDQAHMWQVRDDGTLRLTRADGSIDGEFAYGKWIGVLRGKTVMPK